MGRIDDGDGIGPRLAVVVADDHHDVIVTAFRRSACIPDGEEPSFGGAFHAGDALMGAEFGGGMRTGLRDGNRIKRGVGEVHGKAFFIFLEN